MIKIISRTFLIEFKGEVVSIGGTSSKQLDPEATVLLEKEVSKELKNGKHTVKWMQNSIEKEGIVYLTITAIISSKKA